MPKDYPEITRSLVESLTKLHNEAADFMQPFKTTSLEAMKAGAIDQKTKEFIALAIGINRQCDGCIGFHTKRLVKMGTTREEFIEVLKVAIYMGGGPGSNYAADALRAFEQFSSL